MAKKGQYTAADIAPDQPKQMGQYTAADLDTSSSSQTAAPPVAAQPGALSRLVSGATNSTVGTDTNQGVEEGFTQGLPQIFKHPLDSAGMMLDAESNARQHQLEEAAQHYQEPGIAEKIGGAAHHLYGAVPFLGPLLGAAADKFEKGDWAGGTGSMAGPLSMFFAHPAAQETAGELAGKVGEGARAVAQPIGEAAKNASYKVANSWIGTDPSDFSLGKNPGRGLVQEGLWGTRKTVSNDLGGRLAVRNEQLDQALTDPAVAGKNLDIENTVNAPFDQAIASRLATSPASVLKKLASTQRDLTTNRVMVDGEPRFAGPRNLRMMSPWAANQLKRGVGADISWSSDPDLNAVNPVRRQLYGGIDSQIDEAIPGVAPLNQRIGDLIGASKAIDYGNRVAQSGGGLTFNPRKLFDNALNSAPVKTGAAQLLYRGGNALSPGGVPNLDVPLDPFPNMPRYGSFAAAVRRR